MTKTKVMRVALLVPIDADIERARFSGYCWIPAAHIAEHFILLRVNFNPGKLFFPCWLEFLNSTFFIFLHRFYYFFNNHKTCHNGNRIVHKQGRHFHIWYVDPSLHRNNRTRYSRKTEAKTGKSRKLQCKENKLRETQASLQCPKCLGTQTSVEKNIFF